MSEVRGVIDHFEDDLAVIVFDDQRRVDIPLHQLPEGARVGDAIVLRIGDAGVRQQEAGQAGAVRSIDAQSVQWPADLEPGEAPVSIEIDAEDTAARKQRVQSLLGDIFKKK